MILDILDVEASQRLVHRLGLTEIRHVSISSKTRKGTIAETKAIVWLWEQGYEVFVNPCGSGLIDIVVYMDGCFVPIDVKVVSIYRKQTSWKKLSREQVARGVKALYVRGDDFFWEPPK